MNSLFQAQHWLPPDGEGLHDVLAGWQASSPRMGVFALVPEALSDRMATLQQQCTHQRVPLVGAVFPALVTAQGFRRDGIWLLRMDTMPPHMLIGDLPPDLPGALHAVRHEARDLLRTTITTGRSLFVVFDSMLPCIASLMTAVCADQADQLRCWGVNAGSESFQPLACLFDNRQLVGNSMLALSVPGPTSAVVGHGYPVSKARMKATATHGNCIDVIDGRPALAVYQEVVKSEYGVDLTRENFYTYAVHFPLGVVTALDVLVRIPCGLTEEGAIFCVGEVPPHSSLRVLHAPDLASSRCVSDLSQRLTLRAHDLPLTVFYCAGRRMHFGEQAGDELRQLIDTNRASAVHGALTLGELDHIDAQGLLFPRFHNAAIVCVV